MNPGTAVVTLTDIRDIDGTRIADGAKVAISAADMASKDPAGVSIRSAGGAIIDGTPAPNNPNFRVFTILSGSVTATYSSQPVMPASLTGALSVLQVIAADANGNVLGNEAIATFDLNLRSATDLGTVVVSPSSFFVDRSDRRSHVTISVPLPDGSKVAVTAGTFMTIVNGATSLRGRRDSRRGVDERLAVEGVHGRGRHGAVRHSPGTITSRTGDGDRETRSRPLTPPARSPRPRRSRRARSRWPAPGRPKCDSRGRACRC